MVSVEEYLQLLTGPDFSDDDDIVNLENERLPGSCKSQFAMKFKLYTDRQIENRIMENKK